MSAFGSRYEARASRGAGGKLKTVRLDDLSPEMREEFDALTPDQRAWLIQDELLWQRAHAIAARATVDVSGVYHVLRNLQKSPSERLRAGLHHGRYFRADRP